MSESECNELEKAHRNAEYLAKIEMSRQQLVEGRTYTFAMKELEAMESMTIAEMQEFAKERKRQTI